MRTEIGITVAAAAALVASGVVLPMAARAAGSVPDPVRGTVTVAAPATTGSPRPVPGASDGSPAATAAAST
ncbi:serine/threonine protein kinase, partial [Streptomyces sp. WAC06614]